MKGMGGIFDVFLKALANQISRQILIAWGKKKAHRGGNRQSIWRQQVDPHWNRGWKKKK
jgi:hypothetical protein